MGKTISFVVRDELAEWLEQRAEASMRTVSSVTQDIVARRYREETGDQANTTNSSQQDLASSETDRALSEDEFADLFSEYSDKWYHPDGKHEYAVHEPEGMYMSNGPRYFETREGAAKRLLEWWAE